MQFKVPQNVEREDRIIGPITMKQLIICTIGGGLTYSMYVFLARRYTMEVWLPPVAFFGALTFAIAFVKINDIPFLKWVLLLIEFYLTPTRRVWQKGVDYIRLIQLPKPQKAQAKVDQPKEIHPDIHRLVKKLDSPDFSHFKKTEHPQIDQADDENLLAQSFDLPKAKKRAALESISAPVKSETPQKIQTPTQDKPKIAHEHSAAELKSGGEIKF